MLTVQSMVYRPCVVFAHRDRVFSADGCRRFRRLGWDVYQAFTGPEARRLTRMLDPEIVILDVDLAEESGWLTCAKIKSERNVGQVILVLDTTQHNSGEFAELVGADRVVSKQDGIEAIVQIGFPTDYEAAA
jgi:DNA-binding response OmpR family regulator